MCKSCGHIRQRKTKVETVAGEMEELTGTMARESKQLWWSMMNWYMKYNGWSKGRAANVYREKFGVWPRGLEDNPVMPNDTVSKFVKDGIDRYVKSIRRMR